MDIAGQMSVYAAYHRNRWNRATHFIGVPAIVFALLVPMSWVHLGAGVTLAHAFAASVLLYYFVLDVPLALATAAVVALLVYAAGSAATAGTAAGWGWSGAFFVGGWVFQLAGHVLEGRRPALADNLLQIFVAPLFLVAEVFFALGLKRELHERIETKLRGQPA
jgi:uncharacterized membrane protein YGL010W